MNTQPIICYLKPLSDEEIKSLNKYWDLNEDRTDFQLMIKQIDSERAETCRAVSGLVRKSVCLLLKSPAFYCNECNEAVPAKNRSQFLERLNLDSYECSGCTKRKLQVLKEQSIQLLENYLSSILNQSEYYESLSYLDCVFLLAILSDDYQDKKPVFGSDKRINLTGSEELDIKAISRLIDIGALVNIKELPENIQIAETIICGSSNTNLYRHGRYGYKPQRNPLAIERGIYFSLSARFSNIPEFVTSLYERIVKMGITPTECEELKRLVIGIRVQNFYRLIEGISQEFNLVISNSNPLGALISHLSENYPITKCYYTFYHYAKEVVLYIHKNNPDFYSKNHLFTKFVSNYIQDVEDKGWELKITRRLPEAIFTSNVEALVSQHFIDGHFNWHSLTANEVIERWLSKIPINDEPLAIPAPLT